MTWDCHRAVVSMIILLCAAILLAYAVFTIFHDESRSFLQQLEERQREIAQIEQSPMYSNQQERSFP